MMITVTMSQLLHLTPSSHHPSPASTLRNAGSCCILVLGSQERLLRMGMSHDGLAPCSQEMIDLIALRRSKVFEKLERMAVALS
jgi:hypothetical protein